MAVKTLTNLSTEALNAAGATGFLYTDRRDFYLKPYVTKELWSDVTPFTTIVGNQNIVTGLPDPIFKLFEHRDPWVKQQFVIGEVVQYLNDNTGAATSDFAHNSSAVTNLPGYGDSAWVGHVFEVWDTTLTTRRGVVIVTAVGGTSTYNITCKLLGTTTVTTVATDVFRCIGNAQGDGSVAPEAWSDELKVVWGSTQIIETAVEIKGAILKAALRGYSNELARMRLQKGKEHKMHKEMSGLFGGSVLGMGLADSRDGTSTETFADVSRTITDAASSTNKVRTSMGLVSAIQKYGISDSTSDDQNIFTVSENTYKYSNFVDDMEKVFHYYPDGGVKYALCGPGALSYWSKLDGTMFFAGKSGWQVKLGDTQRDSLGFNIRMLETPHGVLALVPTPALRGPYNKTMVVLSTDNLSIMEYEAPQYKTNIKTENAYKGVKDEYFSDQGIGMTLIESHKLFTIG